MKNIQYVNITLAVIVLILAGYLIAQPDTFMVLTGIVLCLPTMGYLARTFAYSKLVCKIGLHEYLSTSHVEWLESGVSWRCSKCGHNVITSKYV